MTPDPTVVEVAPAPEPSRELTLPDELANPVTGVMVPITDKVAVGATLVELRMYRDRINGAIGLFSDALVAESRRVGSKTLRLGDDTFTVSADHEIEWDVTELVKLLEAGLPAERYGELVTEQVTFKVNGNVARQIAGADPAYAAIVDAARKRIPKRPSVSPKARRQ